MSIVPNLASPCANAFTISDSEETSHLTTKRFEEGVTATRSSRSDGLRRVAMTLSPFFSAASVTARPKPDEDPVTVYVNQIQGSRKGQKSQDT